MTNKSIVQETFPVMGMSCASCSARVEKTLNRQPGVRKATVNYASATATVEYDSQNCSPEALQQAVQNAGYDLLIKQDENTPDKVEQAHDKKYRALKFRTTPSTNLFRFLLLYIKMQCLACSMITPIDPALIWARNRRNITGMALQTAIWIII